MKTSHKIVILSTLFCLTSEEEDGDGLEAIAL